MSSSDNRFWGSKFYGKGIWLQLCDYTNDITCPMCSAGKLTKVNRLTIKPEWTCSMCKRYFTEAEPEEEKK